MYDDDNEEAAQMAELLSCMVDALRWSLVRSEQNGGAYTSLPWVRGIAQCYEAARRDSTYADPLVAIPLTGLAWPKSGPRIEDRSKDRGRDRWSGPGSVRSCVWSWWSGPRS